LFPANFATMVMDSTALLSKYMSEKNGSSLKFMQRMLYLIFAEVVYQRELLPRDHFAEKNILGCTLHVPNVNKDRRQMMLHNNLKGAAGAVTDKKLKQYHLMVHSDRNDPSAASEVFIMDVVYADEDDEATMQMSSPELSEVRVRYSGVEELQKQTKHVFRCLRKGLSTLEPITCNVSFSFYIKYRDGVNRSYHPAGYGQAARMYELPATAEIGDMGMLHAKEHACLLQVKSTMLEDGFQLMQDNAKTQRTQSQYLSSSSGTASSQSQDQMSEGGTSDRASSLGVFQSHSEAEETPKRKAEESRRDQRSVGQKSMASSVKTMRFEEEEEEMSTRSGESLSVGDIEMGVDDRFEDPPPPASAKKPIDNRSGEMDETSTHPSATASSDVTMVTRKLAAADEKRKEEEKERKQIDNEDWEMEEEEEEEHNPSRTASTEVSMVTRKLAAADEKREEEEKEMKEVKEEEEETRQKAPAKQPKGKPIRQSHSSIDGGSEASEKPIITRRVSLRKRITLTKFADESTESDEPSVDKEEVEEAPQPDESSSSGKEADTEPSDSTVVKQLWQTTRKAKKAAVAVERRRSDRLKRSPTVESSPTVPSDDSEGAIDDQATKSGGKKKDEEEKVLSASNASYQSAGETVGTNPSESGTTRPSRGRAEEMEETPKRAPRVRKSDAVEDKSEKPMEPRTPGQAPMREKLSSQQLQ
ncbi:hypothetical protein PFISCL1PPCAC_9623, partial [Pristionchus fissidentatus]